MIANQGYALKTLTGGYKTYTITPTSPMLKAAMKTTVNAGMDLIKEARKINKKAPIQS